MSGTLPGGANIPVDFKVGQPLTASQLNTLQHELLHLLLTHTHGGNGLEKPQGPKLGPGAIEDDAIRAQHINTNAINRGHIQAGAVGASEIGQKVVGPQHIAKDAVTTEAIKDANVTLAKLAADVVALLNAPREGATSYGYFAWLDGTVAFPDRDIWHDWLTVANIDLQEHDLPIRRIRDDGGIQPIDGLLPPERLYPDRVLADPVIISPIDPGTIDPLPTETLPDDTRLDMAGTLVDVLNTNETLVMDAVGGTVTNVKAEGTNWTVTLATGETKLFTDAQVGGMIKLIEDGGGSLGNLSNFSGGLTYFRNIGVISFEQPVMFRMMSTSSLSASTSATTTFDKQSYTAGTATDDLAERNRISMEVDPAQFNWEVGVVGKTTFYPGTGSNLAFTDTHEPIQFQPGRTPSPQEMATVERMLYHYGIENVSARDLLAVGKSKVYDFLNNPHLMPAGYWTGESKNVRAVVRMRDTTTAREHVRVKFTTAYRETSYVVHVTPEFTTNALGQAMVLSPVVLKRDKDYVDIGFLTTAGVLYNKVNFNLAVHGELSS